MSVHMLNKNEEQWIRRRAAEGANISKKDRDLLEYYDAVRTAGGDPAVAGHRASNAWGPTRAVAAPLEHYLRGVPALESGYAAWRVLSPMQRAVVTSERIRGYVPLHTRPADNPLTPAEARVFNETQRDKAPRDTWRTPIHGLAPVDRESVLMEGMDFDSSKVVKKHMTELDAKGGAAMGREDMREATRDRRVRRGREFKNWLSADGGQAVHAAQDAGKTARRGVLVPEKESRPMVWGYVAPNNKVFYFPHFEESLRNADYLAHAIDGAPQPGSGGPFQLLTDHTYGAYAPWHFRKFSGERGQTFLNNMTKAFAEAAKTASPTGGVVRVPTFSARGGTFAFPYSRLINKELSPGRRAWLQLTTPFRGNALDDSGDPYEEYQPRGITLRQMDDKGGRSAPVGYEDVRDAARDRRIRWEREFAEWLGGPSARASAKGGRTVRADMGGGETDEEWIRKQTDGSYVKRNDEGGYTWFNSDNTERGRARNYEEIGQGGRVFFGDSEAGTGQVYVGGNLMSGNVTGFKKESGTDGSTTFSYDAAYGNGSTGSTHKSFTFNADGSMGKMGSQTTAQYHDGSQGVLDSTYDPAAHRDKSGNPTPVTRTGDDFAMSATDARNMFKGGSVLTVPKKGEDPDDEFAATTDITLSDKDARDMNRALVAEVVDPDKSKRKELLRQREDHVTVTDEQKIDYLKNLAPEVAKITGASAARDLNNAAPALRAAATGTSGELAGAVGAYEDAQNRFLAAVDRAYLGDANDTKDILSWNDAIRHSKSDTKYDMTRRLFRTTSSEIINDAIRSLPSAADLEPKHLTMKDIQNRAGRTRVFGSTTVQPIRRVSMADLARARSRRRDDPYAV